MQRGAKASSQNHSLDTMTLLETREEKYNQFKTQLGTTPHSYEQQLLGRQAFTSPELQSSKTDSKIRACS